MVLMLIVNSLIIFGIHASTRERQILEFVVHLYYKMFSINLKPKQANRVSMGAKVLFNCPPCMASLYGTLFFACFIYPTLGILYLPGWVFSLCGLNYLLNKI